MMVVIERAMEFSGCLNLFAVLAWIGMMLALATMIFMPHCGNAFLHNLYQLAYLALALTLGWSALYGFEKSWQPWPPHLALVAVVDLALALCLVSRLRMRAGEATPKNPILL